MRLIDADALMLKICGEGCGCMLGALVGVYALAAWVIGG